MRPWLFRLLLGVLLITTGRADDVGHFYEADAIVTGTDMRQRPWGMAQCLREVLVKVSGDPRLKDDPRVLELAASADRYVASFDYVDLMAGIPKKDDQGSYDRPHKLTVRFRPNEDRRHPSRPGRDAVARRAPGHRARPARARTKAPRLHLEC